MNIAIIGGGFSGSFIAYNLNKLGHNVTIFEKSRGIGGRMATRNIDNLYFINHGCSSFEANGENFKSFCNNLYNIGLLKKIDNNTFGAEKINEFLKYLSKDVNLFTTTLITQIKKDNQLTLIDNEQNIYCNFDIVISTIPSPQFLSIDADISQDIIKKVKKVSYDSMISLAIYGENLNMEIFKKLLHVKHVKKVAYNKNSIVIFMDSQYSNNYNNLKKEAILPILKKHLNSYISDFDLNKYNNFIHLWKYALTKNPLNEQYLYDENANIILCSDWLSGSKVENAFNNANEVIKLPIWKNNF